MDRFGINRTVLALSFARLTDGVGNSILFVVIPLYVATLPHGAVPLPLPLLVAILISAYGLANAAIQPLTARLTDHVGRHKLIIQTGLAVLSLATLAFVFATRYLDLLVLRVVQGIGLALEIPATMALLAVVSRRETRGATMGFYTTLRMIGLALGPLIGGYLHDRFGNDTAFVAGAVVLALAILVVQFGVAGRTSSDARQARAPAPPPAVVPATASRHVGKNLFAAAMATFLMAAAFTLVTTLENEFNLRLHIGAFAFSVAFSALMISRLFLQVPAGRLSDRLGRKPFVVGGLVLMALSTAPLGIVPTLGWFIVLRLVQGVASAAIVAPAIAYAGDISQREGGGHEGQHMSTVTIGFGLGIAIGPLLAGVLALVRFELPFLATGLLCLIGAAITARWMVETVDVA